MRNHKINVQMSIKQKHYQSPPTDTMVFFCDTSNTPIDTPIKIVRFFASVAASSLTSSVGMLICNKMVTAIGVVMVV